MGTYPTSGMTKLVDSQIRTAMMIKFSFSTGSTNDHDASKEKVYVL